MIMYLCQNFGVRDVHGQIPKAFIKYHTFYLVIFLTIFLALGPVQIELKIANSGETKRLLIREKLILIFYFKKIHALTLRIYF